MTVSVVIPAYEDTHDLRRALASINGADEVIVADDASPTAGEAIRALADEYGAAYHRLDENGGPAKARNAAAGRATGDVLLFLDADCELAPGAIERVKTALADESVAAVFGSYDDDPADKHLISVWKNLQHHHTHHQNAGEATTFWSGCGAVRREVFARHGGFDAEAFGRPCIEDVEFGMRLTAAGERVVLDPTIQCKHRKRWTLGKLLKIDLFDRAVPWSRLMRERPSDKTLNTKPTQQVAALLAAACVALLISAALQQPAAGLLPVVWLAAAWLADTRAYRGTTLAVLAVAASGAAFWLLPAVRPELAAATLAAGGVVALNAGLYRLVARRLGLAGATLSLVPHVLHYLAALLGFAVGTLTAKPPAAAPTRLIDRWVTQPTKLYGALAVVLAAVGIGTTAVATDLVPAEGYPPLLLREDSLDYYAYLPSVAIDGDLDFVNQIMRRAWAFDETHPNRTRNRYPVGTPLTASPGFLAGLAVDRPLAAWGVPGARADGYGLVTQAASYAWMVGVGCLGLLLLHRTLVEGFAVGHRAAAAGCLGVGLFSTFTHYMTWHPLMAHTAAMFWASVCVWASARVLRGPGPWLAVAATAAVMAGLCRPPAGAVLLVPAWAAVVAHRRGVLGGLLTPIWLVPVLLAAAQATSWWAQGLATASEERALVAAVGYPSQERFYWGRPALLKSMLSTRNGLLLWSPVLAVALLGWLSVRRRAGEGAYPLLWPMLLAFVAVWYVNASWYAWWFGNAFGNRGFIATLPLFAIGLGRLVEHRGRWVVLAIGVAAIAHVVLNVLFVFEVFPEPVDRPWLLPSGRF